MVYSMPRRPRSALKNAPSEVQNYIKRLEELAKEGIKAKNQVSTSVRLGKVILKGKKIAVPIIVKLNQGRDVARQFPIDEIFVDGKAIVTPAKKAVTSNSGEWSESVTVSAAEQITVVVGIKNDDGNFNYSSSVLEVNVPKEKVADDITILVPGSDGNKVDELGSDGFITANITSTYRGNGIEAGVEITSEPFTFSSNMHKDRNIEHTVFLSTGKDGAIQVQLKPTKDEQDFFFSLKGTDKIVKISYRKREDILPDTLNVVIPGSDEANISHETTHDNGFLANLELLREGKRKKSEVRLYSQNHFKYKIGGVVSESRNEHAVTVDGLLTMVIYPSGGWQKITFATAGLKPQTFELRKEF